MPLDNPGPIGQGFGQNQQLIITQGFQPSSTPPPSFTATGFDIEVGPI